MGRSLAIALLLASTLAHATPSTSTSTSPSTSPSPSTSTSTSTSPSTDTYRGWSVPELTRAMAERPVQSMLHRYSRSQPVYHLALADGLEVAFRPSGLPYPDLWRFELASYHLARLLGLAHRVPPVTTRTVPRAALDISPRAQLLPAPGARDHVHGAVVAWLPTLTPTGLSGARGRARWRRWLDQRHRLPTGADATRAEQVSSLVVFDYLHANTDRWDNSPNLMADEHGDLVYRDNSDTWTIGRLANAKLNASELESAQRFSRALVAALRQTDAGALAAALEPHGKPRSPILTRRQLRLFDRRRKRVLAHIDRLLRRHGEAAVLPWP